MTSPENNDATIPEIKVERQKKIRAPHRYLADGSYDSKPLSPTYSKNIGKNTKSEVQCEHCKVLFSNKNNIYKHGNKRKRCKKLWEIFATVAVFALIAAENDSNVSAILANI